MAGSNIDRLRYNGLLTGTNKPTLGAGMLIGDLTITFSAALKYAGGQAVPTITGNQFFALTLEPDTANEEIVWLTSYVAGATTGTILRAQEGSVASAHNNGSVFVHAPTALDYNAPTGLQIAAQGNAGLLGLAVYDPAVEVDYNLTTSMVALDATNLSVTFTGPPSGRVKASLEATVYDNGSAITFGIIDQMGTPVAGTYSVVSYIDSSLSKKQTRSVVSGLIPGQSYTWRFAVMGHAAITAGVRIGGGSVDEAPGAALIIIEDAGIAASQQIIGLGDNAWTPVTFQNNWTNYTGYQTGFRKDAMGFVHIRGRASPGTAAAVVFTLPTGYRPEQTSVFTVRDNAAAATMYVVIAADGTVSGDTQALELDLDGISFLAAGSTGQLPILAPTTSTVGSNLLGVIDYRPGSDTSYGTGTMADADAVNLAVTFTVPPSGQVLVQMSARSEINNVVANWAIRESTTTLTNSSQLINYSSTDVGSRFWYEKIITGLVPGSVHTYKWAIDVAGALKAGPSHGSAVMKIYDAGVVAQNQIIGLGDSSWTPVVYKNSWADWSGEIVMYRKDALGYVHFTGTPSGGASGTTMFTLPVGYRPSLGQHFVAFNGTTTMGVVVDTNGNVFPDLTGPIVGFGDITFLAAGASGQLPVVQANSSVQGNNLLGLTNYHKSPAGQYLITATTLTAIDSSNLSVAFTAPASGKVKVTLGTLAGGPGASGSYGTFGLLENGTQVGIAPTITISNVDRDLYLTRDIIVTGLVPGSFHTYQWAASVSTGTLYLSSGPGGANWAGDMVMEVTDAGITAPLQVTQLGDNAWIPLTYQNSWSDYGSPYAGGAFRKDASGYVHLRGLVKGGTSSAVIATLPVGYRPDAKLDVTANNSGSADAIQINTDGTFQSSVAGVTYLTLEGITFLASGSTGTLPVLIDSPTVQGTSLLATKTYVTATDVSINSTTSGTLVDVDATNLATTFTAPASGTVEVHLEALANSGSGVMYFGLREGTNIVAGPEWALNTNAGSERAFGTFLITNLVPGSVHTYKFAFSVSTSAANLYAGPTYGHALMTVKDAGTATGQSIVGIGDSAWTNVTYQNGWVNSTVTGRTMGVRYRKDAQGFIHVEGTMQGGTASTTAFTLPVGYRPQEDELLIVALSNGSAEMVQVLANGNFVTGANTGEKSFGLKFLASGATGQLPVQIAPNGVQLYSSSTKTSATVSTFSSIVPGISLSIPPSPNPRTALTSALVHIDNSAGASRRFRIFLDGSAYWPNDANGLQAYAQTDTAADGYTFQATYPIALPGDNASHTITIEIQALANANAINVLDRHISAVVQ